MTNSNVARWQDTQFLLMKNKTGNSQTRHSLEFIGGNFCQFLFVLVFSLFKCVSNPPQPTPHPPTPPPTPPTPHLPPHPPPTPPPPPTHPPLRFTREQTRVEYIRRCRLKINPLHLKLMGPHRVKKTPKSYSCVTVTVVRKCKWCKVK